MKLTIALLSGDGVGPEVTHQAVKCLKMVGEVFGHKFLFKEGLVGAIAIEKTGEPLPTKTIELCKNSDAILFGTVRDPKNNQNLDGKIKPENGLLQLRIELSLFSNIRPVKVFPSLVDKSPLRKSVIRGTDFVVYRELIGGIYHGEKSTNKEGTVAKDVCTYSEAEISRIAHLAFKAAKNRSKKVTLVDKANGLETSRLWRKVVRKISDSYPEIQLQNLFIEEAVMQMILNPRQFDIILTSNMFGDILSDEGGVIGGSVGLLPSASVGDSHALFEPIHEVFLEKKGTNMANPVASILSAAMILDHFHLDEESRAVVIAVLNAMKKGIVTPDLQPNSTYGTNEVGDYIANTITDSEENLTFSRENIWLGKSTII
ncbi:3-isopropylmalate dehydrogenase [Eudoraea sp.]|uniref:3-isopropylmalate dehydrogenase n=1 Tax=Eudoraea sp. TaxID=1979955 RepID=UPI003C728726